MSEVYLRNIDLKDSEEVKKVQYFLRNFELKYEFDIDFTVIIEVKGEIKATASKAKNVFKCFAISKESRSEGLAAKLLTALTNRLFEEDMYHSFIFTTPGNIDIFVSLGYKIIYQIQDVALLESGIYNINKYLRDIKNKYKIDDKPKAAIVVNCNPFTFGHLFLIETAALREEQVLVFVVQEDKSIFPFQVRYELIKSGTEHLKNVTVIPGGEYIISSATFPGYFLKEENQMLNAYTSLDAGIFGEHFCKTLNIVTRYVGEEPYCLVTQNYNEALKEILPRFGVELKILPRIKNNDDFISATVVRNLIKCGRIEETKAMVPQVTWEFLNTPKGSGIVEKIKNNSSPK